MLIVIDASHARERVGVLHVLLKEEVRLTKLRWM